MSGDRFTNLEFEDGKTKAEAAKGPAGLSAAERMKQAPSELRDAQYYMKKAEKCEIDGDFEQALRSYSTALGEDPLLLDAWLGQLRMLTELEEYAEARMWADKVLERFPANPQVLSAKAVALHRMGMPRQARDLSDAALNAKGESEILWLSRGELMLAESRPAAEYCFHHALRSSKAREITQLRTGAVYLRYEKFSPALEVIQEVTLKMPNSALAWHLLGRAQEQLGLFEMALSSFKQAAELAPQLAKYREDVHKGKPGLFSLIKSFFRRWFRE